MIKRNNKSFRNFVSCLSVCLKDPVNPINYFGIWISEPYKINSDIGVVPIKKIQTLSEFCLIPLIRHCCSSGKFFYCWENKSILKNLIFK